MTGSLFAYTLYVDDAEVKYNAGWFFIGVFLANFGVNAAIMTKDMLEQIYVRVRGMIIKCKKRKQMRIKRDTKITI
jgi:hypothetical protein